jgi:hypothetical protein
LGAVQAGDINLEVIKLLRNVLWKKKLLRHLVPKLHLLRNVRSQFSPFLGRQGLNPRDPLDCF